MAAKLATLRAAADKAPNDLEIATALANELLSQDRPAEALAVVDPAITGATPKAPSSAVSEADAAAVLWLMDARARALVLLGRDEDALATLAKAAKRPEGTGSNVSQTLNLGVLYGDLGKPKEALETIKDVEFASEYGLMVRENIKSCAYAQLGDSINLSSSMKVMKEHAAKAPFDYFEALICANYLDDSAKFLIQELSDPLARRDILVRLQTYADARIYPSETENQHRRRTVLARPDVQAKINEVGRIQVVPLVGDVF
jgi:tetratricopeptide (TPR) repeat protein